MNNVVPWLFWLSFCCLSDIEDLTRKTGNFKQFPIFCSMLESAVSKVTYMDTTCSLLIIYLLFCFYLLNTIFMHLLCWSLDSDCSLLIVLCHLSISDILQLSRKSWVYINVLILIHFGAPKVSIHVEIKIFLAKCNFIYSTPSTFYTCHFFCKLTCSYLSHLSLMCLPCFSVKVHHTLGTASRSSHENDFNKFFFSNACLKAEKKFKLRI